jgi:predicted RNase H-like HicB family nuclease
MRIQGFLSAPAGKDKYWGVEIPLLQVFTQGKSKRDAYLMAKDAIEMLIEKKGFEVSIQPIEGDAFAISAKDSRPLIALMLKRQRSAHGLSLSDMASRLKAKSRNGYARYESGEATPTFDKLFEILRAIDPKCDPLWGLPEPERKRA